jgi:hypothetical protein
MGKSRVYYALAAACLCVLFAQSMFANSLSDNYLGGTWANLARYASPPSRHMGHSLRGGAHQVNPEPAQPNNPIQLITDSAHVGQPQSGPIADLPFCNVGDGAGASNRPAEPPGEFSNFTIYTPNCGAKPCENPPQKFITYATPEPSAVIILLADLLLLGTAAMVLRRRGILLAKT